MTLTTTLRTRRFAFAPALAVAVLCAAAGPARAAALPAPSSITPAPRQSLTGTVIDSEGQPVAEARVVVVEADRVVLTDARGAFRFAELAAGRYTLEVTRPGYEARLVTVDAPGSVDVTLRPSPLPVQALTVTVTRGALSPLRSPLAASAVGREALDRDHGISLAKTLERLPGVRDLSTGREIGKPVIRGLSGSRVLVLSDGMRLEDYAWSDEDGPSVDAAMADRVEVVRGPATVLYGADAVGGVVNVIPRPIPFAADGGSSFDGSVELGARSNNREGDLVFRGEGASGPWGWRVTAAGRKAEALHTPEGELDNTGFFGLTGEAAVARRGEWGSLTARYVRYGGEFKLLEEDAPAGGDNPAGEEGGPERKLSDDRVQVLGNFPVGGVRLEARLQGQRHHMIELEDNPAADPSLPPTEVNVFDLVLSTGLGELLLHHSLPGGFEGTAGVTGKLQRSTGSGVIPLVPDANMAGGGAFVLERWQRGPLTLLGGARADLQKIDATGHPQRAFEAYTGSVGAALEALPGISLTANVGTAWRAPTLFELYASGPRLGEARYEIGDPSLGKERALDVDAGLRWEKDRVRGHVALYRNDFSDFLYIQPTGRTQDGYAVYEYRQADAVLKGGEASLEVEAGPWLAVSATGDLVRATNQDTDEPLPLIPPKKATLRAELHGSPSWAERAFVSVEGELVAAPDRLNPLDIPVDGYQLLNFAAGADGRWGGRDLRVDLSVHNALDTSYRDFLSRYKAFALNPGRDVSLSVRVGL